MKSFHRVALLTCAAVVVLAGPSRADQNDDAQKEVKGFWNVDSMMLQAADNIARRYNLNDGQREQTRKLMVDEVSKFLDDHPDVWPLVRDLARYQMLGKAPDGEVARQIGGRALPLMEDIRNSILNANQRWRNILSEDQKKMHDFDLQDMERTFSTMEKNFREMKDGKQLNPGVLPGPNPGPQPVRPPVPPESAEKKVVPPDVRGDEQGREEFWDAYVRKFIMNYELDPAQSESAWSIMRECKQRAQEYRLSKQKEYADVEQRLLEARKDGQTAQAQQVKVRAWTQVQKSLNKPIYDLFQELKDRLDPIPTAAQREKALAKGVRPERSRAPHPPAATAGVSKDGAAPGTQAESSTPPANTTPTATASAPPAASTAPATTAPPPTAAPSVAPSAAPATPSAAPAAPAEPVATPTPS